MWIPAAGIVFHTSSTTSCWDAIHDVTNNTNYSSTAATRVCQCHQRLPRRILPPAASIRKSSLVTTLRRFFYYQVKPDVWQLDRRAAAFLHRTNVAPCLKTAAGLIDWLGSANHIALKSANSTNCRSRKWRIKICGKTESTWLTIKSNINFNRRFRNRRLKLI